MSFLFTEKCISKILPLRLCYALQPKLAWFFIFHGYFLEDSNVVFWFFAFTIINKNNFTCKQRFGFNENVKQKKSLKVCSQPPMGMVIVLLILTIQWYHIKPWSWQVSGNFSNCRKEAVTLVIQCQWESCFLIHSTETGKKLAQYSAVEMLSSIVFGWFLKMM